MLDLSWWSCLSAGIRVSMDVYVGFWGWYVFLLFLVGFGCLAGGMGLKIYRVYCVFWFALLCILEVAC